MQTSLSTGRSPQATLDFLTASWGPKASVALYLDRCQVDTPVPVVEEVWKQVARRRRLVRNVIDFGAGDGRFGRHGKFKRYLGFEIDASRYQQQKFDDAIQMLGSCAFEADVEPADLVVGNPPYVRNQDLPVGWREKASAILRTKTGLEISGLANAWQYFFLLSLVSTNKRGLCALVIPYEWVSRPSVRSIRTYIATQGWDVSVYRLLDSTFHRVLTTSSITIVDKRGPRGGKWSYFEQRTDGTFKQLPSPVEAGEGVLSYAKRGQRTSLAKRGLSPGTQKVFTLTEAERARVGLKRGRDVLPCVTSLRPLADETRLTEELFAKRYISAGEKCWLINTTGKLSESLQHYIDSVPVEAVQTSTCASREKWWTFTVPEVPALLIATGFTGDRPKSIVNDCAAIAVGGVAGIYGVPAKKIANMLVKLRALQLGSRIVAHSNGLKKLEINQLNTLLDEITHNARH